MANIRSTVRLSLRNTLTSIAVLVIGFLPLMASPLASADGCAPPDSPGVHQPVGADAVAFSFDCASGLWFSAHFSFNPYSGAYTPLDALVATYNPSTGLYDYVTWIWNAPSGDYIAIHHSVANPPAGATVIGGPTTISNTGAGSNNTINNDGGSGSSINGTGPNSNNTVNGVGNSNSNLNNNGNYSSTNNLTATANSGNSLVLSNGKAGSAQSGDVQDVANIMNMLQSSSNALGGDMVTFVANIDGDVNGDFMLDPNQLGLVQPSSAQNLSGNNTTTMNNEVDADMTNNINLDANSGDATVDSNTEAGDANTGNAKVVANIVNLLNSAITSGKSFMGVININGNLNGDILLPPDFVDQLVAANVPTVDIIADTGPNSNNTINSSNGSNDTTVNNNNTQGITNNINATATTGSADVTGNTSAGNATSGTGKTTITAFNLTGSNVIGNNAILVFVNVQGKWVGLIMDAPPGSSAAALGSGISNTGPSSNNTVNGQANNTTNIDNDVDQQITNNVNANARSGNARVSNNTKGGNAKSGDANVAINLLNVENSTLSLSGWFGIIFINVFGTWNGSFGINTSAGDKITAAANGAGGAGSAGSPSMAVFAFVPHPSGSGNSFNVTPFSSTGGTFDSGSSSAANAALAANANHFATNGSGAGNGPDAQGINWLLALSGAGAFFLYTGGERLRNRIK